MRLNPTLKLLSAGFLLAALLLAANPSQGEQGAKGKIGGQSQPRNSQNAIKQSARPSQLSTEERVQQLTKQLSSRGRLL